MNFEWITRDVQEFELTANMSKHLVSEQAYLVTAQVEMGQVVETAEKILSVELHHCFSRLPLRSKRRRSAMSRTKSILWRHLLARLKFRI